VPRWQAVLLSGSDALARPYRVGPQHAAQFAGPRQIGTVPGAQREVLRLTGQEAVQPAHGHAGRTASRAISAVTSEFSHLAGPVIGCLGSLASPVIGCLASLTGPVIGCLASLTRPWLVRPIRAAARRWGDPVGPAPTGPALTGRARKTSPGIGERASQLGHRIGKPVVRVGPDGHLLRVDPSRGDTLGEPGKLVTAPLTNSGKRHRVPGEVQSDLIRPPRAVVTADGHDRQNRPIYAA
jgi:hypothetical protein